MRFFAWGCLAVLVAAAWFVAPVSAQPVEGSGVGVDAFYASAGVWDAYSFDHAQSGWAWLVLSWSPGRVVSADYDLTLYRPGALEDGSLTSDEVVARSWTYASDPAREEIVKELPAGRYVVTVEPIRAQGEAYVLDGNGALSRAALAPGVKLFL